MKQTLFLLIMLLGSSVSLQSHMFSWLGFGSGLLTCAVYHKQDRLKRAIQESFELYKIDKKQHDLIFDDFSELLQKECSTNPSLTYSNHKSQVETWHKAQRLYGLLLGFSAAAGFLGIASDLGFKWDALKGLFF